jgi:hypothetical protein
MTETLPGAYKPKTAVVVGAGADEKDATRALAKKLQIPVHKVDFSRDVTAADKDWDPSQLENALALALTEAEGPEGINFRPGPGGLKKLWAEDRPAVLKSALLAVVLVVLALSTVVMDTAVQKNRLERLNRQTAAIFSGTFPEVRTVVDPLQQMRVKVRDARQAAGLAEGNSNRMRVIDILREISLRVPAAIDVDLGQAVIGPEGVRISGTTKGFDAVDRIKNSLAEAPGFASVNITSATVEKSSGRIQFKLNMAL